MRTKRTKLYRYSCNMRNRRVVSIIFTLALTLVASSITDTGTVVEFSGAISRPVAQIISMYFSMNQVPSRAETTKYLTIPNITCTLCSPMRICKYISPTMWRSWLAAFHRRRLSQRCIRMIRSGFTGSWHIKLGPTPLSDKQFIGRLHGGVRPRSTAIL